MDALQDSNSAISALVGAGYVRAAFARWTLGDRVYGDSRGGKFIKHLSPPPPEIWEIRVTEPITRARVFGRFAEPDTFIALGIHTRQMLGRKGSTPWLAACQTCVSDWTYLFPNNSPHSGQSIHDYVTGNCDDFPI